MAAKIPRITTTMRISTSVKPWRALRLQWCDGDDEVDSWSDVKVSFLIACRVGLWTIGKSFMACLLHSQSSRPPAACPVGTSNSHLKKIDQFSVQMNETPRIKLLVTSFAVGL